LKGLAEGRADSAIAPYAALELAAIESDAGRYQDAADLLSKLRDSKTPVAPDLNAQAAYRLAFCQLKLDQPRKAIELLDPILKEDGAPALAPAANLLAGECRFKLGRHAEAAPYFEKAVASPPDEQSLASALLRLGECRAATQEWPASESAFNAYLARFKDGEFAFQARFGIGWAKENAGDFDGAIASYRLVTDKHQGPTAARAQFQIGECLFAKKQYDDAARELLRVDILFAYPEWSAAALYEAGRCFEALAKPDLAAEQFKQVKSKYPDTEWARLAAERLNAPRASAQPK
jgi:TolA-binding protein